MTPFTPVPQKKAGLLESTNHFAHAVGVEDRQPELSTRKAWVLLLLVFAAVYFAALFSPPLLNDADATHANAAQHIVLSHDWVTLKVDGIRYLEKPPLPYWMAAIDYHIFGFNVFSTHLPMALGVLALCWLGWVWGRRAYGERAGFYAALAVLTSIGVFLFTRIMIPDVLLAFLIAFGLYCFLTGLEDNKPARFYLAYASIAVSMLAKGMIGPVFFAGTLIPYLIWTGDWRRWREFRLGSGFLLFLAIAAPWHILAGLHNPDQGNPHGNHPTPGNVHGFFYFYFLNEQVFRFLGERYPDDYNKLPAVLYWSLHLVWLFPWSIYVPLVVRKAWRSRRSWWKDMRPGRFLLRERTFRRKTSLLLSVYAGFVLVFFSLSTNQEYYTFPAYLPLLLLTAAVLADAEMADGKLIPWLNRTHAAFAVVGLCLAGALCYGLWLARGVPYTPDIGSLVDYRNVADNTLSMSDFFDLTGRAFAALRLPAILATVTLGLGPLIAWSLRRRKRHFESTVSVAFTAAIFLIAAHIAFVRFGPMLSSRQFADTINEISGRPNAPNDATQKDATLILYGDQSFGSSIIFYTRRQALLVNGRTTSMIWGSCYPDAPHIFLNDQQLLSMWGTGPRKFLAVPEKWRVHVETLLDGRGYLIQRIGDKTLYTDRPLDENSVPAHAQKRLQPVGNPA